MTSKKESPSQSLLCYTSANDINMDGRTRAAVEETRLLITNVDNGLSKSRNLPYLIT